MPLMVLAMIPETVAVMISNDNAIIPSFVDKNITLYDSKNITPKAYL